MAPTELALVDPDEVIEYNFKPTKIRDLPQDARAGMGMGHFPEHIRAYETHPGDWPYTPEECLNAISTVGVWINDGQNLVCPGCGLDGT